MVDDLGTWELTGELILTVVRDPHDVQARETFLERTSLHQSEMAGDSVHRGILMYSNSHVKKLGECRITPETRGFSD